jgi:hypothetical protein
MEIEGVAQRAAKQFEAQHLKHASNLNIRLLRTTAVFQLMLNVEGDDPEHRAAEFLRGCREANPLVAFPTVRKGNSDPSATSVSHDESI